MRDVAKRVLNAASASDVYWKLPDAPKLIWMIERGYEIGLRAFNRKPRSRRERQKR